MKLALMVAYMMSDKNFKVQSSALRVGQKKRPNQNKKKSGLNNIRQEMKRQQPAMK